MAWIWGFLLQEWKSWFSKETATEEPELAGKKGPWVELLTGNFAEASSNYLLKLLFKYLSTLTLKESNVLLSKIIKIDWTITETSSIEN